MDGVGFCFEVSFCSDVGHGDDAKAHGRADAKVDVAEMIVDEKSGHKQDCYSQKRGGDRFFYFHFKKQNIGGDEKQSATIGKKAGNAAGDKSDDCDIAGINRWLFLITFVDLIVVKFFVGKIYTNAK